MADGLLNKASIILTPTGYKAGTLYNVAPIDEPYEDFDFARASVASRVNSSGLVEMVGRTLGSELVQNGDFSQLGSELVTNGDFATDSNWTAAYGESQSSIVISNNQLSFTSTVAYGFASQEINVISGKTYKLLVDIDSFSGSMRIFSASGNDAKIISSTGLIEFYFVPDANTTLIGFSANNDVGASVVVNSISVKQVDPNDYWTLGGGATIGNNKANIDGDGSTYVFINQSNIFTNQGATYKVTADVVITSGLGLKFQDGVTNENIGAATTTGSYTFYFTAGSNSTLVIARRTGGTAFDSSVTNVSVQEIIDTNNIPRISYDSNGDNGHWLLEPTSTNLITYSEDFTQSFWNNTNGEVISDNLVSAPDGSISAQKWKRIAGTYNMLRPAVNITGTDKTLSVFVKNISADNFYLRGSSSFYFYNFSSQTVSNSNLKAEQYPNGWIRLSTSDTNNNFKQFGIGESETDSTELNNEVYIWGAQLEALSYATSYIPSLSGSTVTRATETATGAGSATLINSTEGVLYAEIAALANDGTFRMIGISDGTENNVVNFYYRTDANKITVRLKSGGSQVIFENFDITATNFSKIAFRYKSGESNLFIDGVKQKASDYTTTNMPSGLNELAFDSGGGGQFFYGKCKALAVFNEALSDSELTQLTT